MLDYRQNPHGNVLSIAVLLTFTTNNGLSVLLVTRNLTDFDWFIPFLANPLCGLPLNPPPKYTTPPLTDTRAQDRTACRHCETVTDDIRIHYIAECVYFNVSRNNLLNSYPSVPLAGAYDFITHLLCEHTLLTLEHYEEQAYINDVCKFVARCICRNTI